MIKMISHDSKIAHKNFLLKLSNGRYIFFSEGGIGLVKEIKNMTTWYFNVISILFVTDLYVAQENR